MANWYCKIGGKIYGPYPGQDLRRLVEEGRLLPEDSLREGETGAWFAAREMENLFPDRAPAPNRGHDDDWDEFEDDADDGFDRPRRRRKRGKPSNYYRVVLHNVQDGGQWIKLLLIACGVQILLPVLFVLLALLFAVAAGRLGGGVSAVVFILTSAAIGFGVLILAFFIDVMLFGIPCLLMRVRLDERRHSVLDLFGFAYLIGLIPTLIIGCSGLASPRLAILLWLMYPFFHGGVLAYLMHRYWGLAGGRALNLAGIRFAYHMLFIVIIVLVRLGMFGG